MAPGDSHRRSTWLRALLAALLLAAPGLSAQIAAAAPHLTGAASDDVSPRARAVTATHFSELAEVTPANVSGLIPLVARTLTDVTHDSQRDAAAAADVLPQRFVDEHSLPIGLVQPDQPRPPLQGLKSIVSYVAGASAAELRAWDPIDRHVVWSVHEELPISSGMLVTAGGLVFYGTDDGWFKALDARSGRVLWKHRVEGRSLDEPMTYRGADGHQYIAVRALPRDRRDGRDGRDGRGTLLLFTLAY